MNAEQKRIAANRDAYSESTLYDIALLRKFPHQESEVERALRAYWQKMNWYESLIEGAWYE